MKKNDKMVDLQTFKRKLAEQNVFDLIKDELKIKTKARLRYWLVDHNYMNKVDIHSVYVKIVNYRIKKYGSSVWEGEYPRSEYNNYILNDYDDKLMNRRYKHDNMASHISNIDNASE